jgi:hypothetical protein
VEPAICRSSGEQKSIIFGQAVDIAVDGVWSGGARIVGTTGEDASGIEARFGVSPTPDHFDELARDGGHRFGAGHLFHVCFSLVGLAVGRTAAYEG